MNDINSNWPKCCAHTVYLVSTHSWRWIKCGLDLLLWKHLSLLNRNLAFFFLILKIHFLTDEILPLSPHLHTQIFVTLVECENYSDITQKNFLGMRYSRTATKPRRATQKAKLLDIKYVNFTCRSPYPTLLFPILTPFTLRKSRTFSLIMLGLTKGKKLMCTNKYLCTSYGNHIISTPYFSEWNFFPLLGILWCLLGQFMGNFIHTAS